MRYQLQQNSRYIRLRVEASFTLIDYILLFASALATLFFAFFAVLFFGTLCVKLFTQSEYQFDMDRYELTSYVRVFNYLRFRRRVLSFSEIKRFLLSNQNSGLALGAKGLFSKEWISLEVYTPNNVFLLAKVDEQELEEIYELYVELELLMGDLLPFSTEIITKEDQSTM